MVHCDNDVGVARMKNGWREKNDDFCSCKEKLIK
jgi:hypothetical protein